MINGVRPKELLKAYRQAEANGCEVTHTRGGHIKIKGPFGIVFGPATASDSRSTKNTMMDMRRIGALSKEQS